VVRGVENGSGGVWCIRRSSDGHDGVLFFSFIVIFKILRDKAIRGRQIQIYFKWIEMTRFMTLEENIV